MTIRMIVAVDQRDAIAREDGSLPWHVPADMARFKALTTGYKVFMGRCTFESLGRLNGLPNRQNIVLTNSAPTYGSDVLLVDNWDLVREHHAKGQDLWIIGGGRIYAQAIHKMLVDEIYLTQIHEVSDAAIELGFDLYHWKLFVIRERARGVNWECESIEHPSIIEHSPKITFIKLKKTNEHF